MGRCIVNWLIYNNNYTLFQHGLALGTLFFLNWWYGVSDLAIRYWQFGKYGLGNLAMWTWQMAKVGCGTSLLGKWASQMHLAK